MTGPRNVHRAQRIKQQDESTVYIYVIRRGRDRKTVYDDGFLFIYFFRSPPQKYTSYCARHVHVSVLRYDARTTVANFLRVFGKYHVNLDGRTTRCRRVRRRVRVSVHFRNTVAVPLRTRTYTIMNKKYAYRIPTKRTYRRPYFTNRNFVI